MTLIDAHGRIWHQKQPPKHLHPTRVWTDPDEKTWLTRAELEAIYGPVSDL